MRRILAIRSSCSARRAHADVLLSASFPVFLTTDNGAGAGARKPRILGNLSIAPSVCPIAWYIARSSSPCGQDITALDNRTPDIA